MRALLALLLAGAAAATDGRNQPCERQDDSDSAFCFSQYPAGGYDAFLVIYGLAFSVTGWLSWRRGLQARRVRSGGMPLSGRSLQCITCYGRVSPRELILFANALACAIRVAWLINVANGRDATVLLFGAQLSDVCLRVPQLLWISAMMLLLLVWDAAARKLEAFRVLGAATESAPESRTQRALRYLLVTMLAVVIPADILLVASGSTADLLAVVVVQCFMTGLLTVMGAAYVLRLARLLRGSQSERLQRMGSRTRRVMAVLVGNGVLAVLLLLLQFAIRYTPPVELAYFYLVHQVEAQSAVALLYGLWIHPVGAAARPSERAPPGMSPVPRSSSALMSRWSVNHRYPDSDCSDSPRVSLLRASITAAEPPALSLLE